MNDPLAVQTTTIYSGFGLVLINVCAAGLMSATFTMPLLTAMTFGAE